MQQAFVGIDVGTSSARAGIFDENGTLLATARHPITVWHEAGSVVEQSSAEIWAACAVSVRTAMAEAALPASAINGVGFDATCSLVVIDAAGNPLTVSSSGDPRRNVIVWMDHRAMDETQFVNATGDRVLRYVGGAISPEMWRGRGIVVRPVGQPFDETLRCAEQRRREFVVDAPVAVHRGLEPRVRAMHPLAPGRACAKRRAGPALQLARRWQPAAAHPA